MSEARQAGDTERPSDRSPGRAPERRESFVPGEIAIALSHWDLGVIDSVRELPRGSGSSPKLVIRCERGLLLCKRRSGPGADARRLALAHGVQRHLAARKFPVARLIGTRREQAACVRLGDRVYELFEFVEGAPYDHSVGATRSAGETLARMHRLVADFRPEWSPEGAGFHDRHAALAELDALPDALERLRGELAPASREAIGRLRTAYDESAREVNDAGLPGWPKQVIHADWHPGNLLYRGEGAESRVLAVIDFDTVRVAPRAVDLAAGALQFSLTRGSDDPDSWGESPDLARFAAFCAGYDSVEGCRVSLAEIRAIPPLMVESLIIEALAPIAATGSFARMEGGAFLRMIDRKVAWLREHAETLREAIKGGVAPDASGPSQ
ncbi:MAG: phosphotransferase enzyme family protein [Phycisphaerales bacterium]